MSMQMSDALPYVRNYRKNGRSIRTQAGEGRIGDWMKGKYHQAKDFITSDKVKEQAKQLLLQGLKQGVNAGMQYADKRLGPSVSGQGRKKKARSTRRKSRK